VKEQQKHITEIKQAWTETAQRAKRTKQVYNYDRSAPYYSTQIHNMDYTE